MFKKRLTALVMALSLLLCMIPAQAAASQYNLLLDSQIPVCTDPDSAVDLIYTPAETGLYWLAKSDWESAATYSISPSAPKYNHDAWVADIPHSGPIYELTAGTTYTITVTTDAPMCNINPWLFKGVAPDAIELAPDQKLSGYVGQMLAVDFVLTPHGSYGSVEFSSSDDSIVSFFGGNNATPFCHLRLKRPGTATITATCTTSSISTSFEVEVKAPLGVLDLAAPTHTAIPAGDSVMYTFTPSTSGDYTCYFESAGNVSLSVTSLDGEVSCYGGDTADHYILHLSDLQAGTTYYFLAENTWYETREFYLHLTPSMEVAALSLTPSQSYTKVNGGWIDVTVVPEPFYASNTTDIQWSVDGESVLNLVHSGSSFAGLSPVGEGTATVTATLGSLTASCELQVFGADVLLGDDCMTLDLEGSMKKDLTFIAPRDGNYAVYTNITEGVSLQPLDPITDNFRVEDHGKDVILYSDLKAGDTATFQIVSDGSYTGKLDIFSTTCHNSGYFTLRPSANQVVLGSTVSMVMSTDPSGFTPIISWEISDPAVLELTAQSTFGAEFKAIGPGSATVTARTAGSTGYDGSAMCTVDVVAVSGQLDLNSGSTQAVDLGPWETQIYTFEAKADTLYYCYTDTPGIEVRPEVMESGVHGTGFGTDYNNGPEQWFGTMFTPSKDTTVYVYVHSNMGDFRRIAVGAIEAKTPTSMSLNQRMVTLFPGSTTTLRPVFDLFAYEDVTYTVDNPIVDINPYPHSAEITVIGSGSATITATSESGLTATCNVIAIQPHELVPETPYTANVIGGQHQYFSFTAPESGRYVVSCDYQEGLSLYPETYLTDNFRSGDKLLVIYEYLEAGTSPVICLASTEAFAAADVVITAEKGTNATSFTITGPDTLTVGQPAQLEVVYENPSEYVPINTWEPSDRSILNTGMQSSYVVEIVPQNPGVTTITATNRNGVTATKTITVNDIPGTPLPLDQWTTFSGSGPIKVEFTPETDGYYWIKFPTHDQPNVQYSSDLETSWYYDSNYDYCGPVCRLTGGQIYSISLSYYNMNPSHQVLFTKAAEPTSIAPRLPEYTFFTGINTQIDFQLSPQDAWSNTTFTSSDDTILHIGETAADHCYVRPLKAGTVTVTATTHNGHSTTVTVTVKDPIEVELNQVFAGTVDANSDLPVSFTAPETSKYCFIFDESISISKELNNVEFLNYYEDDSYYWVSLEKDECYTFSFHNYNNVALPASVQVIKAPSATGISLTPSFDVFYMGQNPQVNLTVEPVTASDIRSITVSDEDVAIISYASASSITLEPKKAGTVTVIVSTFSGLSASCDVTILENTVIPVGETQLVTVQPHSESYQYAFQAEEGQVYVAYRSEALDYLELRYEDGDYVYSSENTYMTENGFYYGNQFVAQKSGLIRLIACAYENDKPVTGIIGVTTPVDPTGLTLSQTDVQIYTGESVFIDAVFQPIFANSEMVEFSLTGDAVTAEEFSSPRSRRVTGVKAGTATLTVTSASGKTASCTITVVEPSESLQVGVPKELSLEAGESAYFAFTAPDNNWYTINSTGLFSYTTYEHGFASGCSDDLQFELKYDEPRTVLIKVSAPERPSSGTITVNERLYSTDVSIPAVSGLAGTTGQVVIETEPGAYFFSRSNWSVADPTIAQIEHEYFNGAVLNFLKAGTTTLTLKAGGKTFTTTVTVTGEVIPGGKADVSDTDLDDALENKQDDSITLDVTTQEDEEAVATVTLPAGALDKISQQEVTQTTIKMDSATVTLDAKAVANIAAQTTGNDVSLSVYTVEEDALTQEQAAVLESKEVALVVSAKLFADGEPVKKLGGSVSVTIPYELPPEADPTSISVWYLSDSGLMEKMPTAYADGKLTFTTTHFSDYVVLKDAPAETVFTDVVKNAFYEKAVQWAVANGITTGKTATTFAPTAACTRAQVVTFLWRAAGEPEPQSMENPFPDVADGKYYTKAVLWAAEQGITGGYSDGTFGPDKTCTRDQIVTFLWRYMGKPAPQSTEITFPDVQAGKFYTDAVLWAAEQGITGGFNDGTFGPAKTCTRDQIVTFLYRAIAHI